jgi:hypothetical protein
VEVGRHHYGKDVDDALRPAAAGAVADFVTGSRLLRPGRQPDTLAVLPAELFRRADSTGPAVGIISRKDIIHYINETTR